MRINQAKFQEFVKEHGREIICFPHGTYNVTLARFLLARDENEVRQGSVEAFAALCGYNHPPVERDVDGLDLYVNDQGEKAWVDFPRLQADMHAVGPLIDTSRPIIFNGAGRIIDGYQRLYKAFMWGKDEIPYQTLTPQQEAACFSKSER